MRDISDAREGIGSMTSDPKARILQAIVEFGDCPMECQECGFVECNPGENIFCSLLKCYLPHRGRPKEENSKAPSVKRPLRDIEKNYLRKKARERISELIFD